MNRKQYDELYRKAFQGSSKEGYYPYAVFKEHLKEFKDIKKNKEHKLEIQSDLVELCELHSLKWGLLSFSTGKEALLFQSFMTIIANDIQAVINLLMDGLEYQALVTLRNLYEVSLTFLVIIIDDTKRRAYIECEE